MLLYLLVGFDLFLKSLYSVFEKLARIALFTDDNLAHVVVFLVDRSLGVLEIYDHVFEHFLVKEYFSLTPLGGFSHLAPRFA